MTDSELVEWVSKQTSEAAQAGYTLTEGEIEILKQYADNGINWMSLVMHDVAGEN